MKKLAFASILLVGAPLVLSAEVTKEDLKRLISAGISESVISSYVKANGPVVKLSADDLVELQQAGASNGLLVTIMSVSGPSAKPSPVYAPPAQPDSFPSSAIYVDETVPYYSPSVYYVGSYPSYYYTGYSGYYSPSLGSGYRYCGSQYSVGYYRSGSCNAYYNPTRFSNATFSYGTGHGTGFTSGHHGFATSGHSGFGGGHSSSGGSSHGGHR